MAEPFDIRFSAPGRVVPKGNHAGFPIARGRCAECKPGAQCRRRNCFGGTIVGVVITDDGGGELEAWEEFAKVKAISARNAAGARIVEPPGALEVRMIFLVTRPQSHFTTKGALSAEGMRRPMPTTKPDWDKLSRSTADALTGALVTDDSQIAIALVAKVWGIKPGVLIRARTVSEPSDWVARELAAHKLSTAQGALL